MNNTQSLLLMILSENYQKNVDYFVCLFVSVVSPFWSNHGCYRYIQFVDIHYKSIFKSYLHSQKFRLQQHQEKIDGHDYQTNLQFLPPALFTFS